MERDLRTPPNVPDQTEIRTNPGEVGFHPAPEIRENIEPNRTLQESVYTDDMTRGLPVERPRIG